MISSYGVSTYLCFIVRDQSMCMDGYEPGFPVAPKHTLADTVCKNTTHNIIVFQAHNFNVNDTRFVYELYHTYTNVFLNSAQSCNYIVYYN